MAGDLTYMVTAAPGLEDIVVSEIMSKFPQAWIRAQMRGRVLLVTDDPWESLLQLGCIDNLYLHLGWLKVGPHKADLPDLTSEIASLAFPEFPLLTRPNGKTMAIVNASRSGRHTFSRFDAAAAALEGLTLGRGYVPGTKDAHDLHFRLDILGQDALFSLKLTDAAFRFRGQRSFSRAALRPSVAHALVWLSDPREDDVFLDPFCGSGTIPIERAAYPAVSITGGDISPAAVQTATQNAPEQVEIRLLDACDLKEIPSGSITSIVTNLPWGKQIAKDEDLDALYCRFLAEAKRVLAASGRAILLTDRHEELAEACRMAQMQCRALYTISLHGMLPAVYSVTHGN
ncbi:MAG: methyltransferase [Firmicutes bacterium]|nr:methyltransferase [Bacillota bacterium]